MELELATLKDICLELTARSHPFILIDLEKPEHTDIVDSLVIGNMTFDQAITMLNTATEYTIYQAEQWEKENE